MNRPVLPEAFRSRVSGRDWASVQSIGRAGFLLRAVALATTLSLGLAIMVYPQDAPNRAQSPRESAPRQNDKIGAGVREALESAGSVRVLVALDTPASLKRPTRARFNEIRNDVRSSQNAVVGALNANEHTVRRRYRLLPAFAAAIHSQAALDKLAAHPLVVRVDLDEKVSAHLAESVPHIRADSMHAHGYTGEGVVVAILDTGIDTDHPDLSDDLIHEECFMSGPYCHNGLDRQSGPGAAEDDADHGTHVAGIISSAGTVSSVGVAPDAQIVAIKVLDAAGYGWASDILAGLDWILENRPDVDLINMSLGSGLSTIECDLEHAVTTAFAHVINALRAVGTATFASSGNNQSGSSMGAPACVSGTISVGAVDDADVVASFSNGNAYTDLLAPGVSVVSDLPGGTTGSKGGTSMASPHAVGCAALQLEAGRATTPGSLEAWLKSTGTPVTDARNGLTFPRVDCFAEPTFGPSGSVNDNLLGALPVGPLPYSDYGSTLNATYEPSEAFASCSSDHGNSIWWSFIAPETRRYEVNTNGPGINTGLGIWTGAGHPLAEIACNDDGGDGTSSRLRFDATTGEAYFIRVIGLAGQQGPFTLNVVTPTLPENDDLADAVVIGPLPMTVYGSNSGASHELDERPSSCAPDAGNAVWWQLTAAESGPVYLDTEGSGFNTVLGVWTGTGHPLDEIACNDDFNFGTGILSWLTFEAAAGQTYHVRVSGAAGAEGNIVLNATTVGFDCAVQTDIPFDECEALVALFDSTNGSGWMYGYGWTITNHLCAWYGVSCTDGHVTGLSLSENELIGTLPDRFIDLPELTNLNLSGNEFLTGPIPPSITDLGHLSILNLSFTGMSGPIPSTIGNLSNLTDLSLAFAGLTGEIPPSISNLTRLTTLNVQGTSLTGPIPESIGGLTNLVDFIASDIWRGDAGLTGPIPESIGDLANLETLTLHGNKLSGVIPAALGNLAHLKHLNLSANQFTGEIPPAIAILESLEFINLGGNGLTGPIPESVGNMVGLRFFCVENNSLTGPIPSSIGNLANLEQLYLGVNGLTGRIPASLGNLSNVVRLDARENQLSGPLPPSLGALASIERFNLYSNNLEGTVPLPVAKLEPMAHAGCFLTSNPELCIPDIPEYQALLSYGNICGLRPAADCPPIVHADAKVFLEGPYSNGSMHAPQAFTDHCPSIQPYSASCFDGTSLDYDAPDEATSPPDSVMDWLLVSLRTDVTHASEVPGSERIAFLLTNGSIVDTAGGLLAFPGVAPGAYRLVVRHRNHASVMSAAPLDFSDGIGSWDFTTSMTQAYSAAGAPMKQLSDGRYGMFACDANVDGQITAPDFNLWIAKTTAGATGYEQADCNLDGQVTAPDFNLWNANTTAGAASRVPD